MPITFSGRFVTAASDVIGIGVFDASTAAGGSEIGAPEHVLLRGASR
jgi:hypothetical protein